MKCLEKIKYKYKYQSLFKNLYIIGITGTNGKTTISTLLYKYLRFNNIKATLIGTNGIFINDEFIESINTTPGINILYDVLKKSNEENIKYIIMEVSSHAIKQKRIYGVKFNLKLLTNITIDHLDYHKSFNNYMNTKLKFINSGINKQIIIVNKDMSNFLKIKSKIHKKINTYGFYNNSDFSGKNIKLYEDHSEFYLDDLKINTNMLGYFNCSNILGFLSVLKCINEYNPKRLNLFFSNNIGIDGRMKLINYHDNKIIIDYAHTPDGMEKVLSFLHKISNNNLYVLFGCGGNRDKSKRSLMMDIACKYSTKVIVTSDNPRNEDPQSIINEIIGNKKGQYISIVKREEAIKYAINLLNDNDLLAILGRGNDDYYFIGNNKIYLNDIEYVKEVIKNE